MFESTLLLMALTASINALVIKWEVAIESGRCMCIDGGKILMYLKNLRTQTHSTNTMLSIELSLSVHSTIALPLYISFDGRSCLEVAREKLLCAKCTDRICKQRNGSKVVMMCCDQSVPVRVSVDRYETYNEILFNTRRHRIVSDIMINMKKPK